MTTATTSTINTTTTANTNTAAAAIFQSLCNEVTVCPYYHPSPSTALCTHIALWHFYARYVFTLSTSNKTEEASMMATSIFTDLYNNPQVETEMF